MFWEIKYQIYIVYATTCFVMIPVIYFFFPETGSRSLEEIDLLFESATAQGDPCFSVVKIAKHEPRWFDTDADAGNEKTGAYSSTENSSEPYSEHVIATKAHGPLSGFSSDGSR
jgi:hypothetical protein